MKVAINYLVKQGPWGGGNQFVKNLETELEAKGHYPVFDLNAKDIDIILIIDPRKNVKNISFGVGAALRYIFFRSKNTILVHRINECDERKGTRRINRLLRWTNSTADHTIFIASWLKNLNLWNKNSENSVILNGANNKIFNNKNYHPWKIGSKLKIVTHHWGGNLMKGFDIYRQIDEMLDEQEWSEKINFTYIGNLPDGFRFKNVCHLNPMHEEVLSREIKKHHVYLSASINEPAGMHHIEGCLCGLPVIYRKSGALPEYCTGYGIEFTPDTIRDSIEKMRLTYDEYQKIMPTYANTSKKMCDEYIGLFETLVLRAPTITRSRKTTLFSWPVLRNIFLL